MSFATMIKSSALGIIKKLKPAVPARLHTILLVTYLKQAPNTSGPLGNYSRQSLITIGFTGTLTKSDRVFIYIAKRTGENC